MMSAVSHLEIVTISSLCNVAHESLEGFRKECSPIAGDGQDDGRQRVLTYHSGLRIHNDVSRVCWLLARMEVQTEWL